MVVATEGFGGQEFFSKLTLTLVVHTPPRGTQLLFFILKQDTGTQSSKLGTTNSDLRRQGKSKITKILWPERLELILVGRGTIQKRGEG